MRDFAAPPRPGEAVKKNRSAGQAEGKPATPKPVFADCGCSLLQGAAGEEARQKTGRLENKIGKAREKTMFRNILNAGVAAAALSFAAASAQAQGTVKIGALLPMTGQQQSTGVQIAAAIRLDMARSFGGKVYL